MSGTDFAREVFMAVARGEWHAGFSWELRKFGFYSAWYDCQHRALWLGPFYVHVSH